MNIQAIIFGCETVASTAEAKKTFFTLWQRGYKLAAVDLDKTKSDILLSTAKNLGVEPRECAVVEDAFSAIDAAKSKGMTTIGIGRAKNYILADMCIFKLSELLDIFR